MDTTWGWLWFVRWYCSECLVGCSGWFIISSGRLLSINSIVYSLNICQAHKLVDYDYSEDPSYCDWSRFRASSGTPWMTRPRCHRHHNCRRLSLTRPRCVPVLKHPTRPRTGPLKAHSTRKLNPPNDPGYRPAMGEREGREGGNEADLLLLTRALQKNSSLGNSYNVIVSAHGGQMD